MDDSYFLSQRDSLPRIHQSSTRTVTTSPTMGAGSWISAPSWCARRSACCSLMRAPDGDAAIAPGVDARFAPGHTPGSSLIVLSSGNERALILGDTVHCPLELTDPDFSLMADMDQALADRTREAIRRELEDGQVLAAAPHFPGLQFGRLLSGEGRRRWLFTETS